MQSFDGLADLYSLPNDKEVFYAELLINSALVALATCTTIVMWRKYSNFPRLFTWQWLVTLTVLTLEPTFVSVVTGLSLSALYSDLQVARGIAQAIAAGLWVWYVHKSVRVRNTFVGSPAVISK